MFTTDILPTIDVTENLTTENIISSTSIIASTPEPPLTISEIGRSTLNGMETVRPSVPITVSRDATTESSVSSASTETQSSSLSSTSTDAILKSTLVTSQTFDVFDFTDSDFLTALFGRVNGTELDQIENEVDASVEEEIFKDDNNTTNETVVSLNDDASSFSNTLFSVLFPSADNTQDYNDDTNKAEEERVVDNIVSK